MKKIDPLFIFFIFSSLVAAYVGYSRYQKRKLVNQPIPTVTSTKPTVAATNIPAPAKVEISNPVPEGLIPADKAIEEFKNLSEIKVVKDNDIFCLRKSQKVFFLPREWAVLITREKKLSVTLPKEITSCLTPGSWKLWVTEFDKIYQLPYRYYFQINVSIESLKPDPAPTAAELKIISDLFSTQNFTEGNVKVQLSSPTFSDFRFHPTALGNSLYANIQETQQDQTTDSASLVESLKDSQILRGQYLSPSSPHLNIKNFATTAINDIFLDSDLDILAENISLAHFYHNKKIVNVYVKKVENRHRYLRKEKNIRFNDFLRNQNNFAIIDVRTNNISKKLSLKGANKLSFRTFGANYPYQLVNVFKGHPATQKIIQQEKVAQTEVLELANKNPNQKYLILSSGDGDIFAARSLELLTEKQKENFSILIEGFHHAFIYSYFFGGLEFETFDNKIIKAADFPNEQDFLLLGFF